MDILSQLTDFGVFLAQAASILAIIYLPMIVAVRWVPKIDDKGFFLQPVVWVLAIVTGIILGASLIAFNIDPDYFTVNNVFRTDGPWALSYSAFIRDRVNPFNYSFQPVFEYIRYYDADYNMTVLMIFAATTFGLLCLRAFATWGGPGALRGILFGALVVAWSTYMTVFSVCLVLWLLNLLNFWTLAVLTFAIHLHRNQAFPVNFEMLAAPVTQVGGHGHGHGGHGHGSHGHGSHGHGSHGLGGHGDHGHRSHDHHGGHHGSDGRDHPTPVERMLHP